jgi:putative DNA primase/helicase
MVDDNGSGQSSKSPEVDFAEAERFLKALDPTARRFTFQTFDDVKGRDDKNLARVLHGTLAELFEILKDLNDRGACISVTVNETDFRGRSRGNIVRIRALWVDLDGTPLEPVLADPRKVHIVVESSPGRWHAYWRVCVAFDQFSAKQEALIALYGGDPGVKDLSRAMRLPGFVHRKGTPHLVRVTILNDAPLHNESAFPHQEPEPHRPADGDGTADVGEVAAAVAVIPNPDLDWGEWCSMLMAIHRATGGAGLEIAREYSRKSVKKNNDAGTEKKWRELHNSPPDEIGAGTLFFKADEANPRWRALVGVSIKQATKVADLAALPPLQYEQRRKQAARDLGMRVPVLDEVVWRLRPPDSDDDDGSQGTQITFEPIELWPDAVDGVELINDMVTAIRKYVILGEHQALTVALWVLHAYGFELADHTPRLQIRSPTKRCGKTTLLNTVAPMLPRVINTENITTAALFRVIEMHQPTLLIDEADSFLNRDDGRINQEMFGILNGGFNRGGTVTRTVGEDHEPRAFNVFGPLAYAWLVKRGVQVDERLEDRSITIELRRRLPDEKIERLRSNRTGHLEVLAQRAARWVADHEHQLRDPDPALPDALNDRAQDAWRLMVAIADVVSEEMGAKTRVAALQIAKESLSGDEDASTMALADVAAICDEKEFEAQCKLTGAPTRVVLPEDPSERLVKALSSQDIVCALAAMEDKPWGEWRRGQPLTQNSLARLLKPFGIKPKVTRFPEPARADPTAADINYRLITAGGQVRTIPYKNSDRLRAYGVAPILEAKKRFVDTLEEDALMDSTNSTSTP